MKQHSKLSFIFLPVILLPALIISCAAPESDSIQAEAPVTIQMFGNLDETFLPYLNHLDEIFPDISIKYEFQWDNAGAKEPERRILNGDGPDLFIVDQIRLMQMAKEGLLLDLTNEPFVSRYHTSVMTSINPGGQVFGLPLPGDLQCLVYNKGILESCGISNPPETIYELLDICKQLTEKGQKAIIVDRALYLMILQTLYLAYPEGYIWLEQYNQGAGTMKGTPAEEAWHMMEEFIQYGGCTLEESSAVPARKTEHMINGDFVFRSVSTSNLHYMLHVNPEMEVGALPLLGKEPENQWLLYSKNIYCFAANGELSKPENAAKKQAVIAMLEWISTKESQQMLSNSNSATISYVNDVTLNHSTHIRNLSSVMEAGHVASTAVFERDVPAAIDLCITKMFEGGMGPEQAVEFCDRQAASYNPLDNETEYDTVIGTAEDHIIWRKPAAVTVGSPMAQVAAYAAAEAFPEADFAFTMAKNVATSLYPGDITTRDVHEVADGEQNMELVIIEADGRKIREVLDAGIGSPREPNFIIPYGISGAGRLLHPAGMTYKADVTRERGSKITEITTNDGEGLDDNKIYTVVTSRLMVNTVIKPNFSDCKVTGTGKYLEDVLKDYIQAHGSIKSSPPAFEITGGKVLYELP